MRNVLAMAAGLALFAAACGGGSNNTNGNSSGSTGEAATSGSTGGTTTGGTTGGSSTGAAVDAGNADGTPCSQNSDCFSGICGINGTGNCCSIQCNNSNTNATCAAVACDSTGTCVFPVEDAGAIFCGSTCAANKVQQFYCDTAGTCSVSTGVSNPCDNHLTCADAGGACLTSCTQPEDCVTGYFCDTATGNCIQQNAHGPCTENAACFSNVCGLGGSGNCCNAQCFPAADPACDPTSCDATSGDCVYPQGAACGAPSCVNSAVSGGGTCDSSGNCVTNPTTCPNNLGCNPAGTACNTTCNVRGDCAAGFYCDSTNTCVAEIATGPCTFNDQCTSDVCDLAGTGNCCSAACNTADATCGATGCDVASGACLYPDTTTACGTVAASCTNGVGQPASTCDGQGTCNGAPPPVNCTPFICGATACLSTCTDASSCIAGGFCDTQDSACCDAFGGANGTTMTVDSTNGDDTKGCCGIGTNTPCATLTHAMKIIDDAQAQNITINATVGGGGGDWAPKGEVYPIVLGWGVELNAPGVWFSDSNGNAEIFDIKAYSANDTVAVASIVGAAANQVWVGMTQADVQSNDNSAIQVENGAALFIANATVNGSANAGSNAITVAAGGSLTLAEDATAAVTGTVNIGNVAAKLSDGWNGIVCLSTASAGCTIADNASLAAGTSSVVIVDQENMDIDAEDNASITLTSTPVIGVAPSAPGFLTCGTKYDCSSSNFAAFLINGSASVSLTNATIQCIAGDGILMQASGGGGLPNLTMDSSTIQNTEYALLATAGSATVSNSNIHYNYNGVQQGTDGTNEAVIDLSGGKVGGNNNIACALSAESVFSDGLSQLTPAVVTLNTTSQSLDAENVLWDTTVPDQFMCDSSLTSCTCQSTSCSDTAGIDGMDAVYEAAGTVDTANNGNSKDNCSFQCGSPVDGFIPCSAAAGNPACCENQGDGACCTDTINDCSNFCD